jgi:uncharacterized membrane protein YhdT
MTSKTYFSIAGVFIFLYIITSFDKIIGFPEWIRQFCIIVFAITAYLGYQKKKSE